MRRRVVMRLNICVGVIAAAIAWLYLSSPAHAAVQPEDDFIATIKKLLGTDFTADWVGIEKLPGVKWAPLPPTMLQNCLPDGGCFTRQGAAAIGGRNLVVLATGARTFVLNVYFRNRSAPFGEMGVVTALQRAGLSPELARCPVQTGIGGNNWYRLKGARTNPGFLSIQSSCNGKPCEGFVLSLGETLPPLQPNQLRLYTEQCSASGSERKPIATVLPHELLAQTLVLLMPQMPGATQYDWKTLTSLAPAIKWTALAPTKADLSYKGDPNPLILSGTVTLSHRTFHMVASGTPTQVKTIYFDEAAMHPRGEDLLGALRAKGFSVQLVRCGPVYTESINNWYRVTSMQTRPVMLKQSIRFDGKQVQDFYELRLDASLPKGDPRDRNPGVGGCK
jgi:hypothetical protein